MRLILNPLKSLARPRWLHKYQSVVSSPLPHLKKRDKMEKEGLKNRRVLGSRLLFLSSIVHESLCFSSSRPVLKDWNKETEILKGFNKQVKRERSTSTEKVNPSQGVECKKEWSQTYSWYCWLSGVARIIPVTHKFQIIYIKRATGSADTSCYVIIICSWENSWGSARIVLHGRPIASLMSTSLTQWYKDMYTHLFCYKTSLYRTEREGRAAWGSCSSSGVFLLYILLVTDTAGV